MGLIFTHCHQTTVPAFDSQILVRRNVVGGVLTDLTKTVIETALEAELDEHLGYGYRDHPEARNTGDEEVEIYHRHVFTTIE